MKINSLYSGGTLPYRATAPSETDVKIAAVAEELIASIPAAGVVIEIVTILKFAFTMSSAIVTYVMLQPPRVEFGYEKHSMPAHWYTRWWTAFRREDSQRNGLRSPIFDDATTSVFKTLQQAIKNAVEKKELLPHAIFIGPRGTGKSMACSSLAIGANVNYYLATEQNFIEFAQHTDDVVRFFRRLRENHYPTILLIDEAKLLLESEEKISQNECTHRAFQQFKTYAGTKDSKVMFLFTTNKKIEDINPTFLSRMTYPVIVSRPGPKELKEIVRQQAVCSFGSSALMQVFTPDTINYLVEGKEQTQGVFLGRSGRRVEDAFISLKISMGENIYTQTRESLHSFFSEYFMRFNNRKG